MIGPRPPAPAGLLVAGLFLCLAAAGEASPLARLIDRKLDELPARDAEARADLQAVREAYAARGFRPGWGERAQDRRRLTELLADAAADGLDPADYSGLDAASSAVELELSLSLAAVRYGRDLAHGRLRPDAASVRWLLSAREADASAALRRILGGARPDEALAALAPAQREYHRLRSELNRLRRQGQGGGERARRIALNMERWRWVPDRLGPVHCRVNVPEFRLSLHEDGRETLSSRVIVGRNSWATPAFTDELRRVMVNPYWNVPDVIARHELLPKLKRDPQLLQRRRYTVLDSWRVDAAVVDPRTINWQRVTAADFPYRLRQEPGGGNALGRLIFMLGNDFEIYLHDTPGKRLFERSDRALSHGCIRVEGSRALAETLFAAERRRDELQGALASGRNGIVELETSVPLHVLHFTATPADGGGVTLHPDLYGVDAAHARALASRRPRTGF